VTPSSDSDANIVHFLWSESQLEDLEAMKMRLFKKSSDALTPDDRNILQTLLRRASQGVREIRQGAEAVVLGKGNLLATQFKLGEM
jgi:hypothetical protein